jgi:hypothetical protein
MTRPCVMLTSCRMYVLLGTCASAVTGHVMCLMWCRSASLGKRRGRTADATAPYASARGVLANGASTSAAAINSTRYVTEFRAHCMENYQLVQQRAQNQRLSKQEELLAERYLEGCQVGTEAEARSVQEQVDSLRSAAPAGGYNAAELAALNSAASAQPLSIGAMFARSLPQPTVAEFELPAEYTLMRTIPYQNIIVNRYAPEHKPKKLKPQDIQVCCCTGRDHHTTARMLFTVQSSRLQHNTF